MKAKFISPLLVILLFGHAASAQIPIAPDPETEALRAASRESDPFTKIQKFLGFEARFPNSKLLPEVYVFLLNLLQQRNDRIKIEEVGETAGARFLDKTKEHSAISGRPPIGRLTLMPCQISQKQTWFESTVKTIELIYHRNSKPT